MKEAQIKDPKLDSIRRKVESGNVTVSRDLNRGETKFVRKKDLLYRQFTRGNNVTLQLVVPEGFLENVLRFAHETLITEHLGIKITLNRVVSEFFGLDFVVMWIDFVNCDICQRTIQKDRATTGKLPLIDRTNVYRWI